MSLSTNIQSLVTRLGTEFKGVYSLVQGTTAGLTALTTANKNSVIEALNGLQTEVTNAATAGGASIDDTQATGSPSSVWSSQKTYGEIQSEVTALVDSSPASLDTLNELAEALGDDANFAATTATSLGNRLRVDAAQGLSGAQQAQGIANLGVVSAGDIGDPDRDFVADFNAALV